MPRRLVYSRLSALGSRLSALGSRLSALGSRLSALGSRLSALGSRLSALGSRLSALGSRLSALGSRLSALGSRLSALGSRLSALGSRLSALGSPNCVERICPRCPIVWSPYRGGRLRRLGCTPKHFLSFHAHRHSSLRSIRWTYIESVWTYNQQEYAESPSDRGAPAIGQGRNRSENLRSCCARRSTTQPFAAVASTDRSGQHPPPTQTHPDLAHGPVHPQSFRLICVWDWTRV